jgi:hypothetical protein
MEESFLESNCRTTRALGILVVLAGCLFALPFLLTVVTGQTGELWIFQPTAVYLMRVVTLFLYTSFSVYLIRSGLRMVNPTAISALKFGWGKILVAFWLILSEASWYCHVVPKGTFPLLEPSNGMEEAAMTFTAVAMCLVAVYLLFRGIQEGIHARESLTKNLQKPDVSRGDLNG